LAHVEWAVDTLTVPIVTNGLRNSENVRFGEGAVQRRAPMPAGTEAHHLVEVCQVGAALIILSFKPGQIDQQLAWSWLTCIGGNRLVSSPVTVLTLSTALTVPPAKGRRHSRCSCGRWKTLWMSRILTSLGLVLSCGFSL